MDVRTHLDRTVTEAALQQAVIDLAQLHRWLTYHTFDSRRSTHGFPDLVLAKPGQLLFAELKSATGTVSAAQQSWLDTLTAAGAEVHVWRPDDWPAIVERIRRPAPVSA